MEKAGYRRKLAAVAGCAFLLLSAAGCETMRSMVPEAMKPGDTSRVTLSGSEEVPPVATSGSGSGSVTVGSDGAISGRFETRDVAGNAAHIHIAPKGSNGPVILPLTKSGDNAWVVPPGAKLTEAQMAAYKAGNLYVNVHTARNPGGEVRGQIQP